MKKNIINIPVFLPGLFSFFTFLMFIFKLWKPAVASTVALFILMIAVYIFEESARDEWISLIIGIGAPLIIFIILLIRNNRKN